MVCLVSILTVTACEQQSSPTVTSTAVPTYISAESTPGATADSAATDESMPTLAGVVFSHDESLWQVNRDGKPVRVLNDFPNYSHNSQVSWDSKRIIFEKEDQLWIADLANGERVPIAATHQSLSRFGWVQGQSNIAHYAFKQPDSQDFEHYPITITVIRFSSDNLGILEENQFSEVSRFASVSPDGNRLAYHNNNGAWVIHSDHSIAPFDAKEYGMAAPPDAILTNPAWSPDGNHIAWAISGTSNGKYQTTLAVFDLNSKTGRELHQYDAIEGTSSIQWFRPIVAWSPDSNWIALEAGDAAFGDDTGVWVLDLSATQKHHIRGQELIGWSWDSRHLCHRLKDYSGYTDVPGWEEHRLTPLPFDSWGFIDWTMPLDGE
jgi:hypothetical protein